MLSKHEITFTLKLFEPQFDNTTFSRYWSFWALCEPSRLTQVPTNVTFLAYHNIIPWSRWRG